MKNLDPNKTKIIIIVILLLVFLFLVIMNFDIIKFENNIETNKSTDLKTALIGLQNAKKVFLIQQLDSNTAYVYRTAIINCAVDLTTSMITTNVVSEKNMIFMAFEDDKCIISNDEYSVKNETDPDQKQMTNLTIQDCEKLTKEEKAFTIHLKPKKNNEVNYYSENKMIIYVPSNYTQKCYISLTS
ncbi:MAG: hypothetical protein N3E37_02580 [Candidatus Micrarchaeota archaeon]|nr:hypothetical protein [Candidatus Micrarchaeota archaeon]